MIGWIIFLVVLIALGVGIYFLVKFISDQVTGVVDDIIPDIGDGLIPDIGLPFNEVKRERPEDVDFSN